VPQEVATYSELRIRFERAPDGDTYVVHASGPAGETQGQFRLPGSKLELENLALKLSRGRNVVRRVDSSELALVRRYGTDLFNAVFSGDIRDLYRDSFTVAQGEGKGLRLTLALSKTPELLHVPWEYLYDDPAFLSISTWTPVVRYLDLPRSRPPLPVTQPLRILAMVSSPSDVVSLDVGQERRNLEEALAEVTARGAITIRWLEKATLRELQRELRRGAYHVFHFIGHGGYDTSADDGVLLLEDDLGRSRRISGMQLGTMLADETALRLAVLNSCEGARTSSDDPYAGVATSLIQREVPAVVAMQFEITDRAAILFGGEFYAALADGYPVDSALAEARKAIFADQNDVEWGTPVLYMRVPDGRIFDVASNGKPSVASDAGVTKPSEETGPPPLPPPPPPSLPPASVRRAMPKRGVLIAAGLVALGAIAAVIAIVVLRGGGTPESVPRTTTTGGPGHTTLVWSRRTADPSVLGGSARQEMTGVAPLPEGNAVAVGTDGPRGNVDPAVWTYEGRVWHRQIKKALAKAPGRFNSVAASTKKNFVVVAVGRSGAPAPTDPGQDALVWTFADGRWRRTCKIACGNGVEGGGPLGQMMYSVVYRQRGGFAAVGTDAVRDPDKSLHFDAAVWTSPDGLSWRRVRADPRVFGGRSDQVMRAVTETRSGLLVAVGWDQFRATVWTSRDGLRWQRTHVDDRQQLFEPRIFHLTGVAEDGSRLIAVGYIVRRTDGNGTVVAWASTGNPARASSWRKLAVASASDKRDQILTGVVATGAGAVAVGYDHGRSNRQVAGAWLAAPAGSNASSPGFKTVRSNSFEGNGNSEMDAVVQLTDGRVLAVGDGPSSSQPDNPNEQDAEFWTTQPLKARP
jgi:CHAT domain-containing protein